MEQFRRLFREIHNKEEMEIFTTLKYSFRKELICSVVAGQQLYYDTAKFQPRLDTGMPSLW